MRLQFPSLIILFICFLAVHLVAQDQKLIDDRYKVFDSYDALKDHIGTYAGQTVIINFWATYCGPCVKEVPYFDAIQDKYKTSNVKVILVNLDFKNQLKLRLDKYLDTHPLDAEVVVLSDQDADAWIPRVDADWDGSLPFTLVVKGGETKDTHRQEFQSFEDLDKFVQPYISPKPVLAAKRRR